jgi:hypothetical protein
MKLISLFALIAASTVGCSEPLDPNRLLEVRVATNRDVVTVATPVEVRVTVVNRSAIVVKTAAAESYACGQSYVVLDRLLRELRLPGRICLAIGYPPKNLLPGESLVIRDSWNAESADADGRTIRVQPGQYFLKGRVWAERGHAESSAIGIRVE